ncbi:MAG: hypothetical protein ACI8XM_000754 [Haloarculaceae archaeon]|jgi:hypothetical protein
MTDSNSGTLTLVFTLDALQRLERPGEAVRDARAWSRNVGVVTDASPEQASSFVDRHDVDEDFISGENGVVGALALARQRYPTDRHVLVGTSDEDRSLAQSLGWEYEDVAGAAEAAGWDTADD